MIFFNFEIQDFNSTQPQHELPLMTLWGHVNSMVFLILYLLLEKRFLKNGPIPHLFTEFGLRET